jgi:hypothetical protein
MSLLSAQQPKDTPNQPVLTGKAAATYMKAMFGDAPKTTRPRRAPKE